MRRNREAGIVFVMGYFMLLTACGGGTTPSSGSILNTVDTSVPSVIENAPAGTTAAIAFTNVSSSGVSTAINSAGKKVILMDPNSPALAKITTKVSATTGYAYCYSGDVMIKSNKLFEPDIWITSGDVLPGSLSDFRLTATTSYDFSVRNTGLGTYSFSFGGETMDIGATVYDTTSPITLRLQACTVELNQYRVMTCGTTDILVTFGGVTAIE